MQRQPPPRPSARRPLGPALLAVLALAAAPPARGDSIALTTDPDARVEHLASFRGTLSVSAIDARNALLIVELTNTIAPSVGGYLTGFVLNNPSGLISGVRLRSAPEHFDVAFAEDGIGIEPFGRFDIEVGLGDGRPDRGLAAGASGRFELELAGSALGALSAESFLRSLSAPPGDGADLRSFVARFQAIGPAEDGDKVAALIPTSVPPSPQGPSALVPEPSSALSLALGLGGLAALGRVAARRRRR